MSIWWWLLVTIRLVCGNEENFEDLYDIDVNQNLREENPNEDVIEPGLSFIPDTALTRKKRSFVTEERYKRQPKFHSWGGKRSEEDEKERYREDGILNNMPNNVPSEPEETPDNAEEFMNKYTKRMKQKPAFSSWGGKRVPEVVGGVEKKSNLYNSILQQELGKAFSEQNSKRYPAFNSWAGKRAAAFNSWGGKRLVPLDSWEGKRTAAFNSWGGKRSAAFNSWGGKRAPFNTWEEKRAPAFNSLGGKRAAAFNSWGGKRATAFNSWGGKRNAAFNSWGGKRAAAFNSWEGKRAAAFNSWGGKRAAAFNSWGGKRGNFVKPQNNSNYNEGNNLSLHNDTYFPGSIYNYKISANSGNLFYDKTPEKSHSSSNSKPEMLILSQKLSSESVNDNLKLIPNDGGFMNSISGESSSPSNEIFENKIKGSNKNEKDFTEKEPIDSQTDEIQYTDDKYSAAGDYTHLNKRDKTDYFKMQPRYPGFSSWAGKRNQLKSNENRITPLFAAMNEKKSPLFSNWYGNKIPTVLLSNGKRRPAFSSWGGKRSDYKKPEENECLDCSLTYPLYRSGIQEVTDIEAPDTDILSSEEKGLLRKKRNTTCVVGKCRDKRSYGNVKKNPAITRMMLQGGMVWPVVIKSLPRGTDFYAWGGKRSS